MVDDKKHTESAPIPFPFSRVSPQHTPGGYHELRITALAKQLGLQEWQLNGHWCSCCQGI